MSGKIAKIAVSAAKYWIDRPYDYLIPAEYAQSIVPGMRVTVPFGRGNKSSEGIVLAVADASEYEQLKCIIKPLDETAILTTNQIKLALFMRDHFYCTVFDAVKAMLPTGLWFTDSGKRKVNDKYLEMAKLSASPMDAAQIAQNKRRKSHQQANLLELLCSFEALPSLELLRFTGASRQSLKALCTAGLVELYKREVYRRPKITAQETKPLPVLNLQQERAFRGISELSQTEKAAVALLFGVTGSGKTSVYIHLINEQLKKGKSAILLVPEIALTPQMLHTFSSHFGEEIAVLHSSLSTGERYDEWKRIKSGKARVVIGTRSAIFAPAENLGIIIIDEEQEESYKSESNPRYHARDVAKFLCAKANCVLLLGSATPDLVSMYNAQSGKYSYFSLETRYNEMLLPTVRLVDMKQELRKGNGSDISEALKEELSENLSRGEQSILFINRRGANKLISCGECGYTYKCPKCSVSLTYHSARNRLLCHHCGHSRGLDKSCPDCGGILKHIGAGTQLVEEQLHELFPDVPVMRLDTDTVTPVGSHEELFDKFREEKIPIMVGTQMVTKGLNFENVTLVGVISADQSLYVGDYRAGARTFSLITQVVGRSGRGEKPGRAIIQTFTPANETILQASRQNYEEFYQSEIELRRLQNAPPFCEHIAITASGQDEDLVFDTCRYIKQRIEASTYAAKITAILGPTPLAVVKLNNRYRYRVNLSCTADAEMRNLVSQIVIDCCTDKRFKGVSVFADNDPID